MSDHQNIDQQSDLLRTIPDQYETVFADVVGECNLRCVYCYQSDKNYKPHSDMSDEVIESTIEFAKMFGRSSINVTSEGEFTFGKNWQAIAWRLLESGLQLCMTSNLAKVLEPDEIKTLSYSATICVSLDSADRKTLKSIRRSADVRTIAHNVLQIRAAALAEGRIPTPIIVNCVLSTGNASNILDLVSYCYLLGASGVFITPLHVGGDCGFDKAQLGEERVDDPLSVWDVAKLKGLYDDLVKCTRMSQGKVNFGVSQSIAQRLVDKLKGLPSNSNLGPGLTRVCIQPWDRIFIHHDGGVWPCCYGADPVGNISTESFEDVVNGEKMMALKRSLLTGVDLPPFCRNCAGEAIGTTGELVTRVSSYLDVAAACRKRAS